MNKKIFVVLLSGMLLSGCTSIRDMLPKISRTHKVKPVKPIKESMPVQKKDLLDEEVRYAEIDNQYNIFDKINLPKPRNYFTNKIPYLVAVNDNKDVEFSLFSSYDEGKALAYYKNLNYRAVGDNSLYWRWKTSISKNKFYDNVESKLKNIIKNNKRNVLKLVNGSWVTTPSSDIGNVKYVKVAVRGVSGVVNHLLVETSNGKYLVLKEYNVRRILATGNNLYGSKGGSGSYNNKPISNSVSILPSAYLAIDDNGGEITIYGSGYGHGAGMPQYSAFDMARQGYTYEAILKKYYRGAKLSTVSEVLGSHDTVKVGITNNGNLEHKSMKFKSETNIKLTDNKLVNLNISPGKILEVRGSNGSLIVNVNGKEYKTNRQINLSTDDGKITVYPLNKSHTNSPSYRGSITMYAVGSSFRIINNVNIEDYLLQVVPSEMPSSFGVEALKTQAVAARTYAISDFLKNRYTDMGFHVKDTVESQVYNNQIENSLATEAIKATAGEILTYNNKPIDAKYFSTTPGFTSNASDIW